MPHIQQLESHVADLIAAGEVVERPASVVKELVENAIDAGSSAIVVEVRRGGMGLIRVTDNGCGIAPAELPTAFLRHATSKLQKPEDLGKIGTLGFRGEALAAISAVSRVDILTRRREDAIGTALHLEGGVPGQAEEAGAPEGTCISVQDLFYNTPARLKFMRKDSAETAAANGLMQHLALSHPDVSFKFLKDGAESLHTPGDGRLDSAIYAALGRDFARSLVPVEGRGGDVVVSGFVTAPLQCRGSRSMQAFFVNGRFIKSQLLTAALEEGYRNQIMKGRFPGCVLSVTLPVTMVDVNVHPAKTQVKFAREQEVFQAVYHTVMDCLDASGGPGVSSSSGNPGEKPELRAASRQDFYQRMDAKTFREKAAQPEERSTLRASEGFPPSAGQAGGGKKVLPAWDTERRSTVQLRDSAPDLFPYRASGTHAVQPPAALEERPAPSTPEIPAVSPRSPQPFVPAIPQEAPGKAEEARQLLLEPEKQETPWRIAGEVLRTYIICESGAGDVWLIDKHAAHERVNFDRLKSAQTPPMRQTLLAPAAVELGREDAALLLENADTLESLGFACEDFGGGTLLVREIPAGIDAENVSATLEEFAENLRTGRSLEERKDALLHTMACKAAIKGGWTSDPAELRVLVEKVQSGEVRYCPHGRPAAVKLTKYELEKLFKRA